MNIDFLDNEGINDKYYQWKEAITHTILDPVVTKIDSKHYFEVFGSKKTPDLHEKYGETLVTRLDKNYNTMINKGLVRLVKLVQEQDIECIRKTGHFENGIFSVFKDDLLKADPITVLSDFVFIDPKTLKQQNLN